MIKTSFFSLCLSVVLYCSAQKSDTLYIHYGELTLVNEQVPQVTFNAEDNFGFASSVLTIAPNETLNLTVINRDTVSHQIASVGQTSLTVGPGDTSSVSWVYSSEGAYVYGDMVNENVNRYIGLTGIVYVSNSIDHTFFWQISEHDAELSAQASARTVDFESFAPRYFTVNGQVHPENMSDPSCAIVGAVGDTIRLVIYNSGRWKHGIHFHGYHATIKQSLARPDHVGREKDTFQCFQGSVEILEFVPDKPGIYPVHDHNLMAVLGDGVYPLGMVIKMNIAP